MNPAPFEASAAQLEDGIRVLSVCGELDLSTAPGLEQPLEQAVAAGDASILIDLSECEFIDSTGIALIVRAWQRLDENADGNDGGRRVVLSSSNEQVRRVLEVTGLQLSIAIYGSRDEALAALRT